jgi:hypothetical protein
MDKFFTSELGHESSYPNALRQKMKHSVVEVMKEEFICLIGLTKSTEPLASTGTKHTHTKTYKLCNG